jgi:predicted nucleic acid-binding OB-fold protein
LSTSSPHYNSGRIDYAQSPGTEQYQRKYEEYAYVLDFVQRGKSATVRRTFNIIGIVRHSKYEF